MAAAEINFNREFLYTVSSFFNAPKIIKLQNNKQKKHLLNILSETKLKTNKKTTVADSFDNFYKILYKQYRCEYIYKNEIATQLLLGRHSFHEAKLFTEVEIHKSKADALIINGTSSVYEIKTELDSFDRLDGQLFSYSLVFDKIYVVTHVSKVVQLIKLIDKKVGILVLNEQKEFITVREARSNKKNVSPSHIFHLLHKAEYLNIINKHYGYIPDAKPVHIFEVCKNLFSQIAPAKAHEYMVQELRKRASSPHLIEFIETLPESLKLVAINSKLTKKDCELITDLLKNTIQ